MKTTHKIFALCSFTIFFVTTSLTSQNYWKGGTPGAENNWHTPQNWSENRVPDWTDPLVIIPDVSSESGYFPQITKQVPAIPSLMIEGGAKITVREGGFLTIDGATTYNHGILNIGALYNYGNLSIKETALSPFSQVPDNIYNSGALAIDENLNNSNDLLAQQ